MEKVQGVFVKHVETTGWPPAGRLANADTFDRLVADGLKESGRKVAYLMVDALRYELGVALEKLLSEDGPVELQAAYAQLPTLTLVGMASLLPGARTSLTLVAGEPRTRTQAGRGASGQRGSAYECAGEALRGSLLGDVAQRFRAWQTEDSGDCRPTGTAFNGNRQPLRKQPRESTLGLIPGTLKLIRVALHKLRGMGFKEAVIVTDHGFFLNAHAEAGDVCIKPQGRWPVNAHDRMMLGGRVG